MTMSCDSRHITVGLVFNSFALGGLERIVANLAKMLRDMGYHVVLLSALPAETDFYPQPEGCERECIGTGKTQESVVQRQTALKAAIKRHGIELLFFHSYFSMHLAEELAIAREAGVKSIVHVHGSVPGFFARKRSRLDIEQQVAAFREADAVIAISRAECLLLRVLGVKARYMPNPVFEVPEGVCHAAQTGHALVWVGRFDSAVKRPMDAVRIFELVAARLPDATLTLVGDGKGAEEVRQYLDERPTLAASVRLTGKVRNVWDELAKADLMLLTSSMEGFPGCVAEAFAAGVPVVGYALETVELCRNPEAYHAVPQESVSEAARVAGELLGNPEKLRDASRAARSEFEKFKAYDQEEGYRALVADVETGPCDVEIEDVDWRCEAIMKVLFGQACCGRIAHIAEIDELKRQLSRRPNSIYGCIRFVLARLFRLR